MRKMGKRKRKKVFIILLNYNKLFKLRKKYFFFIVRPGEILLSSLRCSSGADSPDANICFCSRPKHWQKTSWFVFTGIPVKTSGIEQFRNYDFQSLCRLFSEPYYCIQGDSICPALNPSSLKSKNNLKIEHTSLIYCLKKK